MAHLQRLGVKYEHSVDTPEGNHHIAMFEQLTALNPDRKLMDLTPSINPLLNPDAKYNNIYAIIQY